ncbi:MAG: valine--tRNA ligase [Chthoniobacteraceae bacterium]
MSEIAKTYEPTSVEPKWYDYWLEHGCFTSDPARVSDTRPAYSIVIPPPNVTGVLTLGHVLNHTIQDILCRRARMLGQEVLWLPGTDHAGIATQNVVEKTLRKEGVMKHRDDLGREALVAKIWEWREKYGGIILQQDHALGCSCDWSRTRFTMDEDYSRCVQQVFVDLYRKGLIYRGKRMVNWCPASLTALSDEEVIMKEQNGFMVHFRVEVAEEPGTFLTIATTRPETIPADTAVAVHPNDPRYQHLIGKHVYRALPLDQPKSQRVIPIIADEHVDFEFGTGVLKVTPAHDKADYEIGLRHGLPVIDVLTPDAKMTGDAGADLAGMDRFDARKKATEILEAAGALEKAEPYTNNVGFSERADVPIEPRLSEQWFLKYPRVEEARGCVADGQMKFYPDRWTKVYDHWMENIQDWCISRQLWWGHRVPVWYRNVEQASSLSDRPQSEAGPVSGSADELEACPTIWCDLAPPPDPENWIQDPDVLDTWFSSWLWPFATMGWPEKNATRAKFYPTTDLVTAPDIIFFWVARMIMAGFEYMGGMPFRNVYFTGIIRDKQGRKMSKSLGNSPDPLDLINQYGADALRFGVMRSAPLGSDVVYDEKNVELGRNFCTKLWNAARFRQMQSGPREGEIIPALLTADDRWILMKLDAAIREVSTALDEYRFSDATAALYRFFWNEFCDWYLEASKASLGSPASSSSSPSSPSSASESGQNEGEEEGGGEEDESENAMREARRSNTLAVTDFVLAQTLRLFHPFLPFITEELWHGMGFNSDLPADQGGQTISTAHWPIPFTDDERHYFDLDPSQLERAEARYEVVNAGRGLRRDFNIASNKRVRFVLRANELLDDHNQAVLRILLNAEALELTDATWTAPKGTPTALTPLGELFLPLEGLLDVEAERERLKKEIAKVEGELEKVRAKLSNPNFSEKVPATVLEEHRQRDAAWAAKLVQLRKMQDALG